MFRRLGREEKFASNWIKLFLDTVVDSRGVTLQYNVVHVNRESVVAVVRKGSQLLLTENYRYPIGKAQLEFPAGEIEDGETPWEAAQREVLEETGIRIRCEEDSYSFYPSNGLSDQKIHVVFGEYVEGELQPQYEIMKCCWMEADEWDKRLMAGEVTDAATLIACLYAKIRKQRGNC
ncbi:NUDIX hydrolase [Clostridiaceae bacterium]|nr:NUDIX hydrolase [Clostridiaceae bacterium]RKI12222.1 NUDIX hydrolase [bacterium 1XD21-70]